jgi:hypothetical protein
VIELAAARFAELVELCLLQHFVQSSIKKDAPELPRDRGDTKAPLV